MKKLLLPILFMCLIFSTQALYNTDNWEIEDLDLKLDRDGELFMSASQSSDFAFAVLSYDNTVFAFTAKDATDQEYDHVNSFQSVNQDGEDLGSLLLENGYPFLGVSLTHTNTKDEYFFARIKRVSQQDQLEIGFGTSEGESWGIQTLFPKEKFTTLTQPQVSKGNNFIYIVSSFAIGEENGFTLTMIDISKKGTYEIYRNELITGKFQWSTQILQAYEDDTAVIYVNKVDDTQITYTLKPDSSMEGPEPYDGEFYIEKPFFYYKDVMKSQRHYDSELSSMLYRTAQGQLFASTFDKDGTQICNKQIAIDVDPNYNYIDFGLLDSQYMWVIQYIDSETTDLFYINPTTCKLRGNNEDKFTVELEFPRAYTVFGADGETFIGIYGQKYDGDYNDYNQPIINKLIYIGTSDVVQVKNCLAANPYGCVECDEGYVKEGGKCVSVADYEGEEDNLNDDDDEKDDKADDEDKEEDDDQIESAGIVTVSLGALLAVLVVLI
ncbi:hypothetical protein PPERSA_04403 [Pseudocohnilembus persalinus]|uniref:Uncharacterized protein n=1 Tax=Pseudocohnilembus persalinus TaxID=266149 RepID=A0A0V0QQV3_PSEPJ|nr:hypothetical protein PPERSA_04403 [Pseudocohnilembus persalinus]|eukprot:KRX04588.1 hypothetical protein PPERSA_04403 [Pseudocohnilembus persalinus]